MIVLAGGQVPNGFQLSIDDSCTGAQRVSGIEIFFHIGVYLKYQEESVVLICWSGS